MGSECRFHKPKSSEVSKQVWVAISVTLTLALTFFLGMVFDGRVRTNFAEEVISKKSSNLIISISALLDQGKDESLKAELSAIKVQLIEAESGKERLRLLSQLRLRLQELTGRNSG